MSGVGHALTHPVGTIKSVFDKITHPVRTVKNALGLKMPEIPPVPTVDEARQQQQVSDRVRKRRGVYANVYGGASSNAPKAGAKALLGE